MEWKVIFDGPDQCLSTQYCLNNARMRAQNPIRPTYEGESGMTIRAKELGSDYQIPHLYRYLSQRVGEMKVEFSYQFNRPFLQKMWPPGSFHDVTLKVSGVEFNVHRAVLGLSSPYFTALFSRMREASQSTIELKEVDPEAFEELLRLIYGYQVIFQGLDGARLLVLIRRFQIEGISDSEISVFVEILTVEEEEILEFVDLVGELYGGEHPTWFINHCFDHITPKETGKFKDLLSQLPESFQKLFAEGYDSLSSDEL